MQLSRKKLLILPLLLAAVAPAPAAAQTAAEAMFTVNNTWMLVATLLVFMMHLGFAFLEVGLTQSKNTVNILFKNTSIIAIGILTYAIVGFNLMYPGEFSIGSFFGFAGLGIESDLAGVTDPALASSEYNEGYTYWTDFLFQAMFAATAATIVSGAVAERIKLASFLVFATLYVGLVYPLVGSWTWGGGWLADMDFHDFAGSTLVHSVGGWAALAGVFLLGPRAGKYVNGRIHPIPGHSLPLAAAGMFLLWFGWFGFNGGSVLSADPALVSFVLVTTCIAASAGIIGAMLTTWTVHKHPDASMVFNGALAGLVGITAGADAVMGTQIEGGGSTPGPPPAACVSSSATECHLLETAKRLIYPARPHLPGGCGRRKRPSLRPFRASQLTKVLQDHAICLTRFGRRSGRRSSSSSTS